MIKPKYLSALILISFCMPLSIPSFAMAHKVLLFAWVENNQVMVEAGFGSKRPAQNCEILAYDEKGSLIYAGKTNEKGNHSFKVPKAYHQDMKIELKAGPGHRGEWTLKASEFNQKTILAKDESAMAHQALEKGPEPLKIIAGIGFIFALAFLIKKLKKGQS